MNIYYIHLSSNNNAFVEQFCFRGSTLIFLSDHPQSSSLGTDQASINVTMLVRACRREQNGQIGVVALVGLFAILAACSGAQGEPDHDIITMKGSDVDKIKPSLEGRYICHNDLRIWNYIYTRARRSSTPTTYIPF